MNPNPYALLVHQNVVVRTLLGVRLEAAGFTAVATNSALRALYAAVDYRPSLVLIDMTSPVPGGAQLVRELVAEGDPRMKICVISDHHENDRRDPLNGIEGLWRLSRGQVFHPGFSAAMRRRFEDGIPFEPQGSEPFCLDV